MSLSDAIEQAKLDNLGQILLRSARLFNELCVAKVQEFEPRFTVAHTRLFPHLNLDEGTRPTDLARRLGMSKQAINQLLNDLERMEMVKRVPDPNDGRGRLIVFTDQGKKSMVRGLNVFKDLELQITQALSPRAIGQAKVGLEQILRVLEAMET